MHKWGVPFEVLTHNGKQFTSKHTLGDVGIGFKRLRGGTPNDDQS